MIITLDRKNKSLVWSVVDSQLWLTIFTVPLAVLREEYPLFTKGPPSSSAISWGSQKAPALATTGSGHAPETCASTSTPATGAMGLTLGATTPNFPNTESKRVIGTRTVTKGTLSPVALVDTSREHLVPLPTPIKVNKLEEVQGSTLIVFLWPGCAVT